MTDARSAWGRSALIGSTGFVGGVLARHVAFDAAYASATIDAIAGEVFDTVVCAGAPAAMWRANADPQGDLANLERLVGSLAKARVGKLVLVSTIAVLDDPGAGLDETTTRFETTLAYGRNRRWLETALCDRFPTVLMRLPAVFGVGLKKNLLFDLRHPIPAFLTLERFEALKGRLAAAEAQVFATVYVADSATGLMTLDRTALARHPGGAALGEALVAAGLAATGFTHPDSQFQFYALSDLAGDISAALDHGLDALHLAVEPWRAEDLCEQLTGQRLTVRTAAVRYEDMRTGHSAALGGSGPYLRTRHEVLEAIRRAWTAGDW